MRYQISGKQIDIGEALQTHVKAELGEVVEKYAQRPTEAVVDVGSARVGKLKVGSEFTVVSQGGARTFTLVGTARFGLRARYCCASTTW